MQMGKAKSNKLTILLKGLGRSGNLSPPSLPKKVSSFSPAHLPSPKWARAADLEDQVGSVGRGRKSRVAPEGCFSVYVGPERKRFVVRTEHANHPLFRALLEEAESEYGFCTDGPITLPCAVDLFHRVVWEMDADDRLAQPRGCAFSPRRGLPVGSGTTRSSPFPDSELDDHIVSIKNVTCHVAIMFLAPFWSSLCFVKRVVKE